MKNPIKIQNFSATFLPAIFLSSLIFFAGCFGSDQPINLGETQSYSLENLVSFQMPLTWKNISEETEETAIVEPAETDSAAVPKAVTSAAPVIPAEAGIYPSTPLDLLAAQEFHHLKKNELHGLLRVQAIQKLPVNTATSLMKRTVAEFNDVNVVLDKPIESVPLNDLHKGTLIKHTAHIKNTEAPHELWMAILDFPTAKVIVSLLTPSDLPPEKNPDWRYNTATFDLVLDSLK